MGEERPISTQTKSFCFNSQVALRIQQFMPEPDIQLTVNTFDADCCWAVKFSLKPPLVRVVGEHSHADRFGSPHDLISAL